MLEMRSGHYDEDPHYLTTQNSKHADWWDIVCVHAKCMLLSYTFFNSCGLCRRSTRYTLATVICIVVGCVYRISTDHPHSCVFVLLAVHVWQYTHKSVVVHAQA